MKEIEMKAVMNAQCEQQTQTMAGRAIGEQMARPASPTELAMERLRAEINDVSIAIDLLASKLKPVQTPASASAGENLPNPVTCRSPLVDEIHRQSERIANLTAYVNAQTAQLEI